jgi:hypothetical protein
MIEAGSKPEESSLQPGLKIPTGTSPEITVIGQTSSVRFGSGSDQLAISPNSKCAFELKMKNYQKTQKHFKVCRI